MSRNRSERSAGARASLLLIFPLLALVATATGAAEPVSSPDTLSPRLERSLASLQADWLLWMRAFYQRDSRQAAAALDELIASTRQLGFERLPELSAAAAAAAQNAAREGDAERATWALEAAEALDPGRPETAFAGAEAAWRSRRYLKATGRWMTGWIRVFTMPGLQVVGLTAIAIWVLLAALLAGALFLLTEFALRGGKLAENLGQLLPERLPPVAVQALVAVILLWPLLLPSGPFWLLAWWAALLWGEMRWGERVVLVGLWLVLLAMPILLGELGRRVRFGAQPSAQVVSDLQRYRLSGTLFGRFAELRREVPPSSDVTLLRADLQRHLGEWEVARRLYLEVLSREPRNFAALCDLGVFHYRVGDAGAAREYFQKAIDAAPERAVGHFNLSQVYSDAYLFGDAEQELRRARDLSPDRVSDWVTRTGWDRVVPVEGGWERLPAIRGVLWRQFERRESGDRWAVDALPWTAGAAAAWLLVAVALQRALDRGARRRRASHPPGAHVRPARWVLALPGAREIEAGQGGLAWLLLLVPAALLALPVQAVVSPQLALSPATTGPGSTVLALAGGVAYFVWWLLRGRAR